MIEFKYNQVFFNYDEMMDTKERITGFCNNIGTSVHDSFSLEVVRLKAGGYELTVKYTTQ